MKTNAEQFYFEGLRPPTKITIGMNDTSPMPFGKYKDKPLSDVPAYYFHWLWNNGVREEKNHVLHDYIKENIHAFKKEKPDLIWD